MLGTDIEVIPRLPKVWVSVLRFYESCQSVVFRYRAGMLGIASRPYRTTSAGKVDPVNPYLMDGYRC